ncbi:hypothetical protein GOP47_0020393 [Adiantum capillus-veneris]|uniref:Pentatricopeptide repeat-containing protein n=1 Tax=Adiantum capillus-veneris TaxID=13818 RepID=A0A9D4UCW0_ADICA|nr:hypothetical protein GOP47_0020393 [Adiantum capillus-veneris]
MCLLTHPKARPSDLKIKPAHEFLYSSSTDRYFEKLESSHYAQHEEEAKEEEEEKGILIVRKNSCISQRSLCLESARPTSDECMLLLPSLEDFAHALLTCKKDRNGNLALRLHAFLCSCGLEAHSSLGNYLVPLFVEVGSIRHAQRVFNRLLHSNECAWNTLIAGYSKKEALENAFILFCQMQQDKSVHLSNYTIVALLKACTKSKDLDRGSHIHAKVVSMSLDVELFVGSALVDMYAKCGMLVKAQEVFDNLPDRDVVTWTALLTGYVENGQSEETLKCFEQMQLEGMFPDAVTFVCNMKACGSVGAIDKGCEMYAKAAFMGLLERDAFLGSTLVDMFAKAGLLALAQEVFDRLPFRDVVSWTALITGYVEHGLSEEALKCLEQMQSEGVLADAITVVCSLKACSVVGKSYKGREIHAKIMKTGLLDGDIAIANTLVDMYAKCGFLTNAKRVFDILWRQDVVSWTAIIAANVEHGFDKDALKYLEQMQLEGVLPNAGTFFCSLRACTILRTAEKGQEIHIEIEKRGLLYSDHLGTALVDMYAKCGLFAMAEEVLNMLPRQDAVSWTALISGFVEHGHGEQALRCFKQMMSEGVTPTVTTFLCTLKACASIIPLVEIHAEMERRALLEIDTVAGTTLVDMYAKCGSLTRAQEVFNKLPARDVVSLNALITAYAEYGCYEEALDCYERMYSHVFSPDAVTYKCILKVCGHIGAGLEVEKLRDEIERRGFLEKDLELGTTLIDTYAKLGLISKAQKVFEKLPIQNVTSWNSLFAAYVESGHSEEAKLCLKQMELESISPNLETLLHVLKACGNVENGESNKKVVFDDIERRGLPKEVSNHYTSIGGCTKYGFDSDLLSLPRQVFSKLRVQDIASWSALIAGYSVCGLFMETLECFEQMQLKGIAPNAATLVCSLKACSSMECFEKGQVIHAEIERKGLLKSDKVVGNALIDMYAKCGYLCIACHLLDKLPVRDVVSWTSLMNGYTEYQQWDEALDCFVQMQVEGIVPDVIAYACSLKACGGVGALARGEELHVEVERKGLLKTDPLVGTVLVAMYSNLGMLGKAQDVLSQLPMQGIVPWTAIMTGYLEKGLFEDAICCFEQMQCDGISPDNVSFLLALKACTGLGDADKGRELHSLLEAFGVVESDRILGTALIHMYIKCGLLHTAQQIFDKLSVRDEFTWTSLIAGYTEHGNAEEALSSLEQMELEGFSANSITFMCGLRNCGRMTARHSGEKFHVEIQKKGFLEMDHVVKALIDMYAKCGSFDVAIKFLSELSSRDQFLWTSLIGGFAEHGYGEEALAALDQMLLEGVSLDAAAFVCSLKACSSIGSTHKGRELHAEVERLGLLHKDTLVGTSLVDMYVKCGMLVEAQEVFDKLPCRDVVCWTALIVGYTHYGHGEESLECFEQMQHEGISPDPVSLICILKACSSIGATMKAQEIHLEIERRGLLGRDLIVGNTLINMYAKGGLLSLALHVFGRLPSHDTVSWNSLISGYAQLGESQALFENLEKMLGGGVKPDPVTFRIIFGACSRTGLCQSSQAYFDAMSNDYEIVPTFEHVVSMVDLLCRDGQVDKAIAMVKKLPRSPNLVLWNRVLEACKNFGRAELGKQVIDYVLVGNA